MTGTECSRIWSNLWQKKKKKRKCSEGHIPTLLTLTIYREFLVLGNRYTILKAKIYHHFIYSQCRIALMCFNPPWKLRNKPFQFVDICVPVSKKCEKVKNENFLLIGIKNGQRDY